MQLGPALTTKIYNMNKIERAIYDTKLHINKLQQDSMVLKAKLEAYIDQLDALEKIQRDKSVPHGENPVVTKQSKDDMKAR